MANTKKPVMHTRAMGAGRMGSADENSCPKKSAQPAALHEKMKNDAVRGMRQFQPARRIAFDTSDHQETK